MSKHSDLNEELTTDPLGRGYASMTDKEAADDLNTYYRSANASVYGMLTYCLQHRSRSNVGQDTTYLSILGRLYEVMDADIGADPFSTGAPKNQVTLEMRTWARAFYTSMITARAEIDMTGSELDDAFTVLGQDGAAVWRPPDITAIRGLSVGKQTRAQELELGRVNDGDVAAARKL